MWRKASRLAIILATAVLVVFMIEVVGAGDWWVGGFILAVLGIALGHTLIEQEEDDAE